MADAKTRQRRSELVDLTRLVWAPEDFDYDHYLLFGGMQTTGVGQPIDQVCDEAKELK